MTNQGPAIYRRICGEFIFECFKVFPLEAVCCIGGKNELHSNDHDRAYIWCEDFRSYHPPDGPISINVILRVRPKNWSVSMGCRDLFLAMLWGRSFV